MLSLGLGLCLIIFTLLSDESSAIAKQDHGQPLQCFPLLKTHCSYNYCLKEIGALKCQAVTNSKYECE